MIIAYHPKKRVIFSSKLFAAHVAPSVASAEAQVWTNPGSCYHVPITSAPIPHLLLPPHDLTNVLTMQPRALLRLKQMQIPFVCVTYRNADSICPCSPVPWTSVAGRFLARTGGTTLSACWRPRPGRHCQRWRSWSWSLSRSRSRRGTATRGMGAYTGRGWVLMSTMCTAMCTAICTAMCTVMCTVIFLRHFLLLL